MNTLRRFTNFILQGRFQAVGVAFVTAYIPLLGSISVLISAFITLRKGPLEGFIVAIAAVAPFILKYLSAGTVHGNLALFALSVNIFSAFVVWLLAVVLRRFGNWCSLLYVTLLLSFSCIVLLHLSFPDIQGFWQQHLTSYFSGANTALNGLSRTELPQSDIIRVVGFLKTVATGLFLAGILVNAFLQLIVARWWQAVMFNPGGLKKELYQIRLSQLTGALFLIAFGLSYFKNAIAIDTMPLFFMAMCAAGLSVLHAYFSKKKAGLVFLFAVYLFLIWLIPFSVVVIALVALFDIWLNLRKRFLKEA